MLDSMATSWYCFAMIDGFAKTYALSTRKERTRAQEDPKPPFVFFVYHLGAFPGAGAVVQGCPASRALAWSDASLRRTSSAWSPSNESSDSVGDESPAPLDGDPAGGDPT